MDKQEDCPFVFGAFLFQGLLLDNLGKNMDKKGKIRKKKSKIIRFHVPFTHG